MSQVTWDGPLRKLGCNCTPSTAMLLFNFGSAESGAHVELTWLCRKARMPINPPYLTNYSQLASLHGPITRQNSRRKAQFRGIAQKTCIPQNSVTPDLQIVHVQQKVVLELVPIFSSSHVFLLCLAHELIMYVAFIQPSAFSHRHTF